MFLLILTTLGCNRREPNPCPFGCADDTATLDERIDSGEPAPPPPPWDDPPNDCTPPATTAADPFVLVGSVKNTEEPGSTWFTEILDVAWLPDQQRAITAGQGGVAVFDVTDPAAPETRDHIGASGGDFSRYYNLLPVDTDTVWATHREYGLDVIRVSDADDLQRLNRVEGLGYEGLARSGDRLYIASTRGHLDVFDVSTPTAPEHLQQTGRLGRPWDVVAVGQHAYVADAEDGLVALSLADPDAPAVVARVASDGQPFRLVAEGGYLYMVSGSGGLEIFSLDDPADPLRVAAVDVGGSALDVALMDGLVGVVTQEAVVLFDVGRAGTPAAPIPFAYQETEQFAMTLDAEDGYWVVGDWNILGMWTAADQTAPAIDLSVDRVVFLDDADTRTVEVTNRGGETLTMSGIAVPDGVVASATAQTIAPGASATLSLAWDGGGPLADAEVCVASDDPGRPTIALTLTTGTSGEGRAIGQDAPDFALPDLDGVTHRLSEQRGHPVLLAYFATW